jgi:hypothetical protein
VFTVEPNDLFRFSISFVHCEPVYRNILSAIGLLDRAIGKVEVKVRVAVRRSFPFRFVLSCKIVDGVFLNNSRRMFDHHPLSGSIQLYGNLCFLFLRQAIAIKPRSPHLDDKHRVHP